MSPVRISVGTATSNNVFTRLSGSKRASPLDTWSARNITNNPLGFRPQKTSPFGENQSASYQDQDFQIRGTVLDSEDVPMERRVLLLTRDGTRLGITRSNPDGTFKLMAWNYGLNRTLVVAIPDDSDLRNAVVKWGVIGTTPT